jgi:hypothetical protein
MFCRPRQRVTDTGRTSPVKDNVKEKFGEIGAKTIQLWGIWRRCGSPNPDC